MQSDGKVIIGDKRLNNDGTLDTGFGNIGFGSTPATVNVTSGSGSGANLASLTIQPNGHVSLLFFGIPGYSYEVQRSIDLQNWTTLQTVTASPVGCLPFIDITPPSGSACCRTKSQ